VQLATICVLLMSHPARATDSYVIADGATQTINEFSVCQKVTNSTGHTIYVPTLASAEWSSFRTHVPSGVSLSSCVVPAYFVLLANTYTGNLGGLSGANATCSTRLNADAWLGKSNSNVANSAKVRAFLCDGTACQMPQPNTQYFFATTLDAAAGGASFTSDASGSGPGDSANWIGSTYFGASATQSFWTGVTYNFSGGGTANTNWTTTTSGGSSAANCYAFTNGTSGSGSYKARVGSANGTGQTRWATNSTGNGCSTSQSIICMVDP
jgi:hypothetical protein